MKTTTNAADNYAAKKRKPEEELRSVFLDYGKKDLTFIILILGTHPRTKHLSF